MYNYSSNSCPKHPVQKGLLIWLIRISFLEKNIISNSTTVKIVGGPDKKTGTMDLSILVAHSEIITNELTWQAGTCE